MAKITLLNVKQALQDGRFRKTLPPDMAPMLRKYNNNRSCPCNHTLYRKVLKDCKKQLKAYFPGQDVSDIDKEIKKMAQNHWMVINCKIQDLEKKLKSLPPGRKQIQAARYEDEVTVIVNELDVIY